MAPQTSWNRKRHARPLWVSGLPLKRCLRNLDLTVPQGTRAALNAKNPRAWQCLKFSPELKHRLGWPALGARPPAASRLAAPTLDALRHPVAAAQRVAAGANPSASACTPILDVLLRLGRADE